MMSELAIIVPVYNVEQYLDRCISSLLQQTFINISIVLVDDGSTDNSGEICDRWAKEDNRVTVIHKKNGGLMSAWKCGVQNSEGDYVGFVDSDDWVSADMYEKLMSVAESEKADLVTCCLIKEYEDGQKGKQLEYSIPSGVYSGEKITHDIFPFLIGGNNYKNRGVSPNRVTKVFKRSVLLECMCDCDDRVTIGEDLLTTFSFIQKANKIVIMNDFYPYHYRIRSTSMIAKYSDGKYVKMNILRECMLRANKSPYYDFEKQINTDYIKLILMQLDDEILLSGKPNSELRHSIKDLYRSQAFQDAMKNAEIEKMPIKYRLYMSFFKYGFYSLAILMRKVKR